MKLTLLQENLKSSLSFLQKAVPVKPQLPILSSIKMEAKDNKLEISATDLYFGIKTFLPAKIKEEGLVVVPGNIFKQLIQSLNPGELSLIIKDNNLIIKGANNQTSLVFQPSDEYPQFPQAEETEISLSLESLSLINKHVGFSSASDQTRPVLTTILLKFSKENLEAVATDGFRLAIFKVEGNPSSYQGDLLIPSRAINEVTRIAEQENVEQVGIMISKEQKQLIFNINQTQVFVRLIEGEFPPYHKIVPESFDTKIEVDGEELHNQVKRAQVFSKDSSNIIKFTVNKEGLKISSSSPSTGVFEGNISTKSENTAEIEIAFNSSYIAEFLQANKPQEVAISLNEGLKPAQLEIKEQPNYKYIVMPFRLNQ